MPSKNRIQFMPVQRILFQELQDSRVVLCAPGSKRDRYQMFRPHHPSFDALDFGLHGLRYCLTLQCIAGWQELHRPIAYDNVLSLDATPTGRQIFINGRETEERTTRRNRKRHKDVHVEGRRRLQIKSRTNRSTDSVVADHAISLHLVDHLQCALHG